VVGDKNYECDADWMAQDATNAIRLKFSLRFGECKRNGKAMKVDETFESNGGTGPFAFVDFEADNTVAEAQFLQANHAAMMYLSKCPLVTAFDVKGSFKTPPFRRSRDQEYETYWATCLHCGHQNPRPGDPGRQVTRAHIIINSNNHNFQDVYRCFGRAEGYKDDFDGFSERNQVPLCGTEGDVGSCHDLVDSFQLVLLYDPLQRIYYFYSDSNPYKAVANPVNPLLRPYRRILCWRAKAAAVKTYDLNLLNYATLTEDATPSKKGDEPPSKRKRKSEADS
jgi:hypothetical protein